MTTKTNRSHPRGGTDTKHIVRRRNLWYFQRGIPREHQAALGGKLFSRSLGTADIRLARQRRDRLNLEFEAMLASLSPEVDSWSPAGLLQTANFARIKADPGIFSNEVVRVAEHQPNRNLVEPALVAAVQAGEQIVTATGGTSLAEAIAEHLEALAKTARPSSVSARRRALEALRAHLGDVPVAGITRRQLAQWVGAFDPSEARKTQSNRVGDIAAFFGWTVDVGLRGDNPSANLRKLLKASTRGSEERTRVRPWTPAEVRELVAAMNRELPADDPLHGLVQMALYTGARREELAQLRGSDIEVVDGVTVLRIRAGKSAAAVRMIPVHSAIMDLVTGVAPDAYILAMDGTETQDGRRSHTTGSRFSAFKTAAGFPAALTLHGLRRSAAQRMESAGVQRHIAETVLGHARTSLSYGTYSDGADIQVLRDAVESIDYGLEGGQ